MKSKNAKKLTLAKETLRFLNGNDLALVQGASGNNSDTSACDSLDGSCLPPPPTGTSSDSL